MDVTLDIDGAVAVITLNRPTKLNAITPEMAELLRTHVERVDADPGIRAAVLTGAGERSFCVGSDVRALDAYATPWEFRNRADYGDMVRALRTPIIAAVNGYAYGGGLELALACDIRMAASTATFAAPEIKLGWIGGSGQSALLTHAIGSSNAATMLLTGDPIDAAKALRWGLVTEVRPIEELLPAVLEFAATIAKRPPIAAQTAKANLKATYEMPLEAAIRYERDLQTVCMATEDAAEGRAAFGERREPIFQGR